MTRNFIPMVIEQTARGERAYDIFSRLHKERIIMIQGPIDDEMAGVICAQLLQLESDDATKDVSIYINSPGGLVTAGLAIYDTMNYIECDVSTICIGQAASMGAFLLAAGTKGKRYSTESSRIMTHMVRAGAGGQIMDMEIQLNEARLLNEYLMEKMALNTGQKLSKVKKDMERDYFMSAQQAKAYGVLDEVVVRPK